MKRLIEFPLEGGGSIVVEVDEPVPEGGVERAARPSEISEKAEETFQAALDKIKPAAESIINQLRGISEVPDEIGVEFGIKLNGKFGAVIASAEAEANYKVTLAWKGSR